ncbi:NAD dependent epimerase dehydratase family protein [Teratosphaeria destructans]|uniref:NAD dependent epimerase dehydratase family protein n=1 Tax=Teratosphaeria destructans TaxID=418781 RepID=A0A9W7SVG7_9PEZI|nr:NAD dependent epimerase dehydratase family protein [Teratosphaeria destructans]
MTVQHVQSQGIYHGLPTYPSDLHGLTAVITGANGISGHYMLRVLAQNPQRWQKIFCLSRRAPLIPGGVPDNVEHIPLDFLNDPDDIARVLQDRHVTADYVFFFSYIQPAPREGGGIWSDAEEMTRVNSLLVSNFTQALKTAQIRPKRFMLQTGAKNYGGHLGPTKVPQEETDPRVELEPNFYYPQEDIVTKFCAETGAGWNVCMPGPILGAVPDAAMNAAFPLAVYAAVSKKLGQPFEYPGDIASWQMTQSMSSAMMNAYMEEWAVLRSPPNQRYNTCDSSAFAWEAAWPRVAGWYGIEAKGPQDGDLYTETPTRFVPRGYGSKGVIKRKFKMTDWAKRDEVQKAWAELAEEYGLTQKDLVDVDRVFGFLDGTLCRAATLNFSMDKSRKLGWHGFVDSSESLLEVFKDLAKIKMIPPVPQVKVSFN